MSIRCKDSPHDNSDTYNLLSIWLVRVVVSPMVLAWLCVQLLMQVIGGIVGSLLKVRRRAVSLPIAWLTATQQIGESCTSFVVSSNDKLTELIRTKREWASFIVMVQISRLLLGQRSVRSSIGASKSTTEEFITQSV